MLFYAHEVLLPALGWHPAWHLRGLVGLAGATAITGGFIVVVLAAAVVTQPGRCRVFSVWEHKADRWLRHCHHHLAGTITVTFHNSWGTTKANLITTFSCSRLRR